MNANKAQERLDKLIPAVEKYYENKERQVRDLKRQSKYIYLFIIIFILMFLLTC